MTNAKNLIFLTVSQLFSSLLPPTRCFLLRAALRGSLYRISVFCSDSPTLAEQFPESLFWECSRKWTVLTTGLHWDLFQLGGSAQVGHSWAPLHWQCKCHWKTGALFLAALIFQKGFKRCKTKGLSSTQLCFISS